VSGTWSQPILVEDTRTGAQSFACYAITAKVRTTRRVIRHFTRLNTQQPPPGVSTLTTRELEVFELITRGLSNAEIGRELFISDTTVKPTSPACYRSWTSATRVQAIVLAYQTGLFDQS
jgi:DNA-binding NarL/FixJ family response regulator